MALYQLHLFSTHPIMCSFFLWRSSYYLSIVADLGSTRVPEQKAGICVLQTKDCQSSLHSWRVWSQVDKFHSGSCAITWRVVHVGMFLPKSTCSFSMGYSATWRFLEFVLFFFVWGVNLLLLPLHGCTHPVEHRCPMSGKPNLFLLPMSYIWLECR